MTPEEIDEEYAKRVRESDRALLLWLGWRYTLAILIVAAGFLLWMILR